MRHMKRNSFLILVFIFLSAVSCKKNIAPSAITNNHLTATAAAPNFRVVGYLNTWDNFPDNVNSIDLAKITHLNIAFAEPNPSGNLTKFTGIDSVVNKAHAANVKVLISLGGADLGGTKGHWKDLTTPANVNAFCAKILSYLQQYNLDGVDIDLEGHTIGPDNYATFIQTLSSLLKPQNKLVTAAVATWFAPQIPTSSFDYFDFVNIMSYDATGPWDPNDSGPSAPYSLAEKDIKFWGNKGLPQNKMGLGVPFYGWGFGSAFSQDDYSFKKIVATYPGAENVDEIGSTIYYNGIPTIKMKTMLAMQKASGIMIWELTEDAKGKNSLLNAIHVVITGN